ncbi:MBL fold metallo-hydrolase [Kitasatospora sp. NPDC052868]|uniref:MBL fold metallo-hydrolase n=1 Tax=Kitasatospora sp. NPDC052868 TaxID=3364060 RepID=UPI0037CAE541
MEPIVLGDVEIVRVVEWQGTFGPVSRIVPDVGAQVWRDNEEWLAPGHWEPQSDGYVAAMQTWVVRSEGRTVLVDTGVGNGRSRPASPHFHDRQGDFLGRLARAGIAPGDVDVVVNTHFHADHVGWNTVDAGGEWVPAFPNATYLFPAADDAAYGPQGRYGERQAPADGQGRLHWEERRLMYADSIEPVHRAGQARLWEGGHRIDGNLVLESAPGHTPGSSVLRVSSGGERAVFVGDLLHSPVQILEPGCNSCFCEDQAGAAASRRRVLERAADERELVVPAHFGGAGAAQVRRRGAGFEIARWAV